MKLLLIEDDIALHTALAICLEITHTLGGQIELLNRLKHDQIEGLDTTVRVPLALTTAGHELNQ